MDSYMHILCSRQRLESIKLSERKELERYRKLFRDKMVQAKSFVNNLIFAMRRKIYFLYENYIQVDFLIEISLNCTDIFSSVKRQLSFYSRSV